MRNFIVIIQAELPAESPKDAYERMAELIAQESLPVFVHRANKLNRQALEVLLLGATAVGIPEVTK